jgi:hypothetical protein
LEGFLLFNPTVRLSAEQALENEWINEWSS